MAKSKSPHKRKKKKLSEFESKQCKSARLNGRPNKEKAAGLRCIQEQFTAAARDYLDLLYDRIEYLPFILMGQNRSPEMRALEKANRSGKTGAAYGQAAFDYAFDRLTTQLENIKNEVYTVCPGLLSSSKVLFAMCLQRKSCREMKDEFQRIADSYKDEDKKRFYIDGMAELDSMLEKNTFDDTVNEINGWFRVIKDGYKKPEIKKAWVRTVSTAGVIEKSSDIEAPYVLAITDPAHRGHRIEVPLYTSSNSVRRLSQYGDKKSFEWNIREDGLLQAQVAYEKKHLEPEFTEYRGLDVGITDMLYSVTGEHFGTFTECIDFYKNNVEPLLGQISTLRNYKAKLKKFLRKHKNLPADAKKSVRNKIDRLETAIRKSKKAYRRLNTYKSKVAHCINLAIKEYIKSLNGDKGIVTVLELLDINEFNKSKKANGMLSMFARGMLSTKLMAALNWAGYSFKQIEPAYTSQCCPVCSYTDKLNRNGKVFKCRCCGHEDDADYVGSVNITSRAADEEIDAIVAKYHGQERQDKVKALCLERNKAWKLKYQPEKTEAAVSAAI